MAKQIHKGTELNNVSETWNQNERNRNTGSSPETTNTDAPTGGELDRVVKEEAAEYDNANKEDRVLGGERATINDDPDENA